MRTILLFPLLLAFANASEPVRNDKVLVTDVTLQPGEMQTFRGEHPSVTVYLTDGPGVKRGASVYQAAQPASVRNTGSAALHFARIEFLGNGLGETWGTTGLPPNYKLLLENQYVRVYDIRIPAGAREPRHTHHDRVVVCLSGAQLKHLMPDGREEPSTLQTGEIAWRRGSTHIGQNLGKTDLWVIAVEPK